MSLIQKLFLFIILAIFLPLVVVLVLIRADSQMISDDVTDAIHALETEFTEDIATAAGDLVDTSSIEMDRLTQYNWERLSVHLASNVAEFLYDRDHDIRFLAGAVANQADPEFLINHFRASQTNMVTNPSSREYDATSGKWVASPSEQQIKSFNTTAENSENDRNFSFTVLNEQPLTPLPIYKEITILNLEGDELVKSSDISAEKHNIKDRQKSFAKSEDYFEDITSLAIGEIFVSDVIGAYRSTHILGAYNEENAAKAGKPFAPELSAYAGAENPQGIRFEGIIRMATPIAKNGNITGYLTLAIDHRHIMEITDYIIPENNHMGEGTDRRAFKATIKDASKGNYAFMWDKHGRNIAHPREYFISGFDPETGERVPPWMSINQQEAFTTSGEPDLNAWLAKSDQYQDQSRTHAPNPVQAKLGQVPLDCRYLGFAPQCGGWQQINNKGGYGSFLIYWSGIWKLTTAATIPYYTGQYADDRRGFGYVTIGANIGEFTQASMAARDTLNSSLGNVNGNITSRLREVSRDTSMGLMKFQDQLIFVSVLMVMAVTFVSVVASFNMRKRVSHLVSKAEDFSAGNLSVQIDDHQKDELGQIGMSFNKMANTIRSSQDALAESNSNLERMVALRTDELRQSNQQISDSIDYASRIQRSLLPHKNAINASLGENAIVWQPKDVVGGDFYWQKTIGDRDFLMVMDCTGHGVPGAFMTLIATSTLEQISAALMASLGRWVLTPDLSDLMQQLHEGICAQLNQIDGGSESNDGLDAMLISIPHDGTAIEYCGAQMDVFSVSAKNEVIRHRGERTSLGYSNDGVPLNLPVHHLPNEEGMSYVICSDGITTQIGEEVRRSYGNKNIIKCIEAAEDNAPKTINRAIMRDFRSWQGAEERRDDLTLISFKPNHVERLNLD